MRRIKVTEKDVSVLCWTRSLAARVTFPNIGYLLFQVILPFVVLLTMNIIALVCWTVIAPLNFVRTNEEGTDPWNRPIGSYGHCQSTSGAAGDSVPYLVVIAVVNITALVVANFQAYRARKTRTDFNESSYIAMANASFLQAIVVCIPVIFLTRENPQVYYVVLSVVLFIVSGAILVFIFVPKVMALRKREKNKGQNRSSVRISGLTQPMSSFTRSGTSSSSSGDPIRDVLQQFQRLTWEDKAAVLKKIAPAPIAAAVVPGTSQSVDGELLTMKEETVRPMGQSSDDTMDAIQEATENTAVEDDLLGSSSTEISATDSNTARAALTGCDLASKTQQDSRAEEVEE